MTTQSSLLAHIVPMYGKTELVATEALRYILQQSEAARKALEDMVRTGGARIGTLTRFETEVSGEEGERVDLVCSDRNRTERVLIEAKFWAGLTDNQPNTYIERLPEYGHSALLFVVPAQRTENLWPELCRRAEANHTLSALSESGDLRCAAIDSSDRKMMLASWRAVLMQMDTRASIAGDRTVVRDIEQLRGLTERMDSDAFLPIHSDELGQDFPRRILNLVRLIDDATQRASAEGWADTNGLRITPQWHGYGRYLRLRGIVAWFGINFQHWASNGSSPLWIQNYSDGLWYWVHLPTGMEYQEVLDYVVDQLDHFTEIVAGQGGENE